MPTRHIVILLIALFVSLTNACAQIASPEPEARSVDIPPATITPDASTTATITPTPTKQPDPKETAIHPEQPLNASEISPTADVREATLQFTPTPHPTPMLTSSPAISPIKNSLLLPESNITVWDLPLLHHVTDMRDTITTVLEVNEIEFDLGYPVQGFSPDPIYPRLFIRDTSTLMTGADYFYPAERLKWGVEGFLRQQYDESTVSDEDGWQAGFGAISATVGPDGIIDKATNVSDEEAHLVHAAYVVFDTHGGVAWLTREINGMPVIERLNAAGDWLLTHRRNEATGLIKREHTTDWGDVRFQPTTGNPTDIVSEDVVWTASIYDQALAYRTWHELALMNRAVGDEATAQRWEAEAEALRQATNTHLWQSERGFYRTHLHLTPLEHDFDEDAMVSITNAVAIRCGLTDAAQNAQIFTALEQARLASGARKPAPVLYPPYPEGFFAIPRMHFGGAYQNGGVWDWWAGWQVLAEFETGYSEPGRNHLLQTAADWAFHPGQIFEWQEVTTLVGQGGDKYAGAAGIYAQVIIEGLYGVHLSLANPSLSPRLGDWPGSINVHQPGSGLYLRYNYWPTADSLTLVYDTNFQGPVFPLHLRLPPGFTPGQVSLDDTLLDWEPVTMGQDTYLKAALSSGRHQVVVISATAPND